MDNFGSAYAVGGFGSGFLQGMDAVNKREQLAIEKQKAAREESLYQRSMAQDELRGAFNQISTLKDAFDNGEKVDPAQYSESIRGLNKTLVKHNLPAINDFYDPHFGEYLENGKKVMSGELDVNHPDVIKSLNWRYHDQLNVGVGEKTTKPLQGDHGIIPQDAVVEHKELHSIHPGDKGSIHPELQIVMSWKGSDGKTYTDTVKDPVTYERSVHPDDSLLKPISVHDLFDQHASDTAFYKALNDPGVKAGVIGRYLAMGGKSEDLDNPIKKTEVQQYFRKDPKTGKSMIGFGVLDKRGNIIRKIGDEIPTEDFPGSGAYKGLFGAREKAAEDRWKYLQKIGIGVGGGGDKELAYYERYYKTLGLTDADAQRNAIMTKRTGQWLDKANTKGFIDSVWKNATREQRKNLDAQELAQQFENYRYETMANQLNPQAAGEQPAAPAASSEPTPIGYDPKADETYFSDNTVRKGKILPKDNAAGSEPAKPGLKAQPRPTVSRNPNAPPGRGLSVIEEANLKYWKDRKKEAEKNRDKTMYDKAVNEITIIETRTKSK